MIRTMLLVATTATVVSTLQVWGDEISMPDSIVYGSVSIGDAPVTSTDAVTVFALVEGMSQPVAVYGMGTNPTIGDRYVLQFPHFFQPDGQADGHAAIDSQVAEVYVKRSGGPPQFVTAVAVPQNGNVLELNLHSARSELSAPPSGSPSLCGAGVAGCGALGLLNTSLMLLGLAGMKRQFIRRRWSQS